jgi:DNA polymerase III delta subunit
VLVVKGFEIRRGSDPPSIPWDKAKALFDAVDKAGRAFSCVPPFESGLRPVLMQRAREKGVRLASDAADALVAAVGDNQMALVEELDKIIDAVGDARMVTAADVERLVASWPQRDAFVLADRLMEGNVAAALEILRDLRQSPATRPLPVIMGAVRYKLLQYLAAAAAVEKGSTPDEAVNAANVRFPFKRDFAARLRKHTTQSVSAILRRALQCDVETKSGSSDDGLALETFVVEAATGKCDDRELVGRWLYEV